MDMDSGLLFTIVAFAWGSVTLALASWLSALSRRVKRLERALMQAGLRDERVVFAPQGS